MQKTINITLNRQPFVLEQPAYQQLHTYLERLKTHFAGQAEAQEIMLDIEARIAEHFKALEQVVVTDSEVQGVLALMGSVESLDADSDSAEVVVQAGTLGSKRLYRDSDNRVLAGVAAGIANYVGIDPIIVRILFLLSIFAGGTGVVIYILLWIFVPKATTSAQKLEMQGKAVTLQNMSEMVRDTTTPTERRKEQGVGRRIIQLPFEIIRAVLDFCRQTFFPFLGKTIALCLVLGSVISALLGTIFFVVVLSGAYYSQAPVVLGLQEFVSDGLFYSFLTASYAAGLLLTILGVVLGLALWRNKKVVPHTVTLSLIALWVVCVIAVAGTATKIVVDYQNYQESAPQFQIVSELQSLPDVQSVIAQSGYQLILQTGAENQVEVEGRQINVASTNIDIEDGVLSISRDFEKEELYPCLFNCYRYQPVTVTITLADVADMLVTTDSRTRFDNFTAQRLEITADNNSYINGSLSVDELALRQLPHSVVRLAGSVRSARLLLSEYAHFSGEGLQIGDAEIVARPTAQASVFATQKLVSFVAPYTDDQYSYNPSDGKYTNEVSEETAKAVVEVIGKPVVLEQNLLDEAGWEEQAGIELRGVVRSNY